jgi:hypothetical protein
MLKEPLKGAIGKIPLIHKHQLSGLGHEGEIVLRFDNTVANIFHQLRHPLIFGSPVLNLIKKQHS